MTAADHHRKFMDGCMTKRASSPDFCECAWTEFRKIFTDEEMSAGDMRPEKVARLKGQVTGSCASMIPEAAARREWEAGCTSGNAAMKSYCDCTWTEFRKRFSAAELGDEATVHGDRFIAARVLVGKACDSLRPQRATTNSDEPEIF